jgi:lipid A ethanolaminephosphotransferase
MQVSCQPLRLNQHKHPILFCMASEQQAVTDPLLSGVSVVLFSVQWASPKP